MHLIGVLMQHVSDLCVQRNMYCRLYLALWAVEFQKDCPVLQRHDEFLTVVLHSTCMRTIPTVQTQFSRLGD